MFYPEEAPRGLGRRTRLKPIRKVQGTYVSGLSFKKESDWTRDNMDDEFEENWTGRTIYPQYFPHLNTYPPQALILHKFQDLVGMRNLTDDMTTTVVAGAFVLYSIAARAARSYDHLVSLWICSSNHIHVIGWFRISAELMLNQLGTFHSGFVQRSRILDDQGKTYCFFLF